MSGAVALSGLATVVAAAALAGCGGGGDDSEKERYEKEFRAVLERAEKRSPEDARLGEAFEKGGARGVGLAYARVRGWAVRLSEQLLRLDPPADVRKAHETYAVGIRTYVEGPMRQAFVAYALGKKKRAEALLKNPSRRTIDLITRVRAARNTLRDKGYDLGPTTEELGLLP